VVRAGRMGALADALKHGGQFPAVSSVAAVLRRCIDVEAGGRVLLCRGAPDLALRSELDAIAEKRDGDYYVTAAAVRVALAAGFGPSDYRERLIRLCRSPLPESVESDIRAWAGLAKTAVLHRALLLQLPDVATAEALLADPETGRFLARLHPSSAGSTLLVECSDVSTLRSSLRERGILLDELPAA
jgi:hypothetical protein